MFCYLSTQKRAFLSQDKKGPKKGPSTSPPVAFAQLFVFPFISIGASDPCDYTKALGVERFLGWGLRAVSQGMKSMAVGFRKQWVQGAG